MQQTKRTNNTNVPKRPGTGKGGKARNSRRTREGVLEGEEFRTHRRELWFTISGQAAGSHRFSKTNFPIWFEQVSRLYEKFKFHSIRLHFETGYPSTAQGQIYCAYNTGFRDQIDTDPTYIAAQRGAMYGPVYRGYAISIPKSAFTETPSRRPCRGSDEETYVFDAVYNVAGEALSGTYTVFIDYDVSFYTPQLNKDSQAFVSLAGNYGQAPGSTQTDKIKVTYDQSIQTTSIDFGGVVRKIIANFAALSTGRLGNSPISIRAFRKGIEVAKLVYETIGGGSTTAKTTVYTKDVTHGASAVEEWKDSTSNVYSSLVGFVQPTYGSTPSALNGSFTIDAEEVDKIEVFFNTNSGANGNLIASFLSTYV
uniref:Coat protein n=1 Tax=Statovirus C1 TaxID=1964822 RepID=A0A1U9WUJ9_9VIRU|nr:coat protein [Statovirus C1]